MKDETKMNETMMDEAAADAIGSHSGAESAAYEGALETGSAEEKRFDREMRETVARMAGAAPYMKPSADLRGRVLQATAPTTFKMEDYVKANRETNRFYKWGFYAAMAFLAAGAYFNLNLKQQLSTTQQAAVQTIEKMGHVIEARDSAMAAMVNPQAQQISIKDESGNVTGKAFLNRVSNTALVILPEGLLPPDKAPQLVIKENGVATKFPTQYATAPRSAFSGIPQSSVGGDELAIRNVQPDVKPVFTATAGFGK